VHLNSHLLSSPTFITVLVNYRKRDATTNIPMFIIELM
jgi:hypothetical protein